MKLTQSIPNHPFKMPHLCLHLNFAITFCKYLSTNYILNSNTQVLSSEVMCFSLN